MSLMYLVQIENITTPITSHCGWYTSFNYYYYYGFLSLQNKCYCCFGFFFLVFHSFECPSISIVTDMDDEKIWCGIKLESRWVKTIPRFPMEELNVTRWMNFLYSKIKWFQLHLNICKVSVLSQDQFYFIFVQCIWICWICWTCWITLEIKRIDLTKWNYLTTKKISLIKKSYCACFVSRNNVFDIRGTHWIIVGIYLHAFLVLSHTHARELFLYRDSLILFSGFTLAIRLNDFNYSYYCCKETMWMDDIRFKWLEYVLFFSVHCLMLLWFGLHSGSWNGTDSIHSAARVK